MVVKTIGGIAAASIKTIAGVSVANIKDIGGVSPPSGWAPTPWAQTKSILVGEGSGTTTERLEMDTHSDFDFEYTDAFSISVWFKTTNTTGWASLISKTTPFTNWTSIKGWSIVWVPAAYAGGLSQPEFWINNLYQSNSLQAKPSSGTWADGSWHNVICVKPAGAGPFYAADVEIWMDGVSQGLGYYHNDPGLSATIVNTADVTIGGQAFGFQSSGTGFDGNIDEASIWDKALSSSEIADIYNSGNPTNLADHSAAANIVSWWRMGDGCVNPSSAGGCGAEAVTGLADNLDSTDANARVYDMSENTHNMTPANTDAGDIVEDVP